MGIAIDSRKPQNRQKKKFPQPAPAGEAAVKAAGTPPSQDYVPSEEVERSQKAMEDAAARKPGDYESPYEEELRRLYEEISERPDFSYDLCSDPLYLQYRQQYAALGRAAMTDTMGQAAALTGGYGSSYSQAAGQQSYNNYLQQLSGLVPELYSMALERYTRQGQDLQSRFSLVQGMEQDAYGRYSDGYSRWLQEYGLAREQYNADRTLDYQQFMDMLAYWQKEAQREQEQANWEAEMDFDREKWRWQQNQAGAKSSGSSRSAGGRSSGRSETASDGAKTPSPIHTNGMSQQDVEGLAQAYLSSGQSFQIGSVYMDNWMRTHAIYGTAIQAFYTALRQAGYNPEAGGSGARRGGMKNRRDTLN